MRTSLGTGYPPAPNTYGAVLNSSSLASDSIVLCVKSWKCGKCAVERRADISNQPLCWKSLFLNNPKNPSTGELSGLGHYFDMDLNKSFFS